MDDKVTHVPLTELHPFPGHPFQLRDDDAMQMLKAAIQSLPMDAKAIINNVTALALESIRNEEVEISFTR